MKALIEESAELFQRFSSYNVGFNYFTRIKKKNE